VTATDGNDALAQLVSLLNRHGVEVPACLEPDVLLNGLWSTMVMRGHEQASFNL
jgi:hypothetical protein